eukprot:15482910-Alexandrium_andersonii.AAC.1
MLRRSGLQARTVVSGRSAPVTDDARAHSTWHLSRKRLRAGRLALASVSARGHHASGSMRCGSAR